MAEFHETGYGARFYNGQLPQLITSMERIAAALEKIANKMPDNERDHVSDREGE